MHFNGQMFSSVFEQFSFSSKFYGLKMQKSTYFSSPEPKAQSELIVWDSSRHTSVRASVRLSVRASTLSNINISETSLPIIIKFHQEYHWGGGLTVIGFGLDLDRTLVSMATAPIGL